MALAMKKEKEIKKAATLARAEKAGLMASSISKFNSELRKDEMATEEIYSSTTTASNGAGCVRRRTSRLPR